MEIAIIAFLLLSAALLLGGNLLHENANAPTPPTPAIGSLANAIALAEGSNPAWNNPGDLTISFGYPTSGAVNSAGVLQFVNPHDGWNALYKQLLAIQNGNSRYKLTDTLADFGMGYSGGDPNWAVNVASALGIDPSTQLGEILT